jgi:hypothetical protein
LRVYPYGREGTRAVLTPLSLPEISTPKAFTKVVVIQILNPVGSAASAMAPGMVFKFPLPKTSSCRTCSSVADEVPNVSLSALYGRSLPKMAAHSGTKQKKEKIDLLKPRTAPFLLLRFSDGKPTNIHESIRKKGINNKSGTIRSRVINFRHEPGVEDVAVCLEIEVLPVISGVQDILLGRRIRHHLKRKTLVRQIQEF